MDAAPPAAVPPTVSYGHLLSGAPEALAAVTAAFQPAGLGLVLVRLPPPCVRLGAPRAAALAAARDYALLPEPNAQRAALAQSGLGSDVPLGRRRRGAATFSGSCSLTWPPQTESEEGSTTTPCDPGFVGSSAARGGQGNAPTTPLRRDLDAVGSLLVHVAALVARAMDAAAARAGGDRGPRGRRPGPGPLESCVVRSGAAKVRLIHYYSRAEGGSAASTPAAAADSYGCGGSARRDLAALADWQGWHFDYGLLTALCGPAYYCRREGSDSDAHDDVTDAVARSGAASAGCGLVVLRPSPTSDDSGCSRPVPVTVHVPADCVAVQVGEAAQILTGGAAAATAHCVVRPRCQWGLDDVSRSVCVAFLQPPCDERMEPATSTSASESAPPQQPAHAAAERGADSDAESAVLRASAAACGALAGLLPPLSTRWTPGATFADFSKAVTQAYYGGRRRR